MLLLEEEEMKHRMLCEKKLKYKVFYDEHYQIAGNIPHWTIQMTAGDWKVEALKALPYKANYK